MALVSTTETASYPDNLILRKLNTEWDSQFRGLLSLPRQVK